MVDYFFAGGPLKDAETLIESKGYCRLFSYFNELNYLNKVRFTKNSIKGKLFVDSGAFTAWTKGICVDVNKYIEWLNTNEEHIYLAGQVDCIPGKFGEKSSMQERKKAAECSWENYLYMKSRLNNPNLVVYTFHLGEDYLFLQNALKDKSCKYIALGGTVGSSVTVKKDFFNKCFSIIKKSNNPNVKVHGFGMTSLSLLPQFSFASVDSTSWKITAANGNIFSDYGIISLAEKDKYCKKSILYLPKEIKSVIENNIQRFGYTLQELSESFNYRALYNVKYLHYKVSTFKCNQNLFKNHLF